MKSDDINYCYFCDSELEAGDEDDFVFCEKCGNGPLCDGCLSEETTDDGAAICIECWGD